MTWTIKIRSSPGALMTAEYECPLHGRFEATVERDTNGDPPSEVLCRAFEMESGWILVASIATEPTVMATTHCNLPSPWTISAPQLKRDSVPCYAAVRGGDSERRPGMLDTRALAEGQPMSEWKAKQAAATQERRHHELIRKGLKTKRVQV
jgi:hypothetical protein